MPASPSARDTQFGLLGTAVAVTTWGLSGVLVKAIDMDALAVGFWRFSVYAVLMCGYLAVRGQLPGWRVLRASMWGGLSLGLDVACFFTAIKLTSIVDATTIGSLQPLLIAVVAAKLFGERIRLRDAVAALVAIAAVVVIVFQSSGTPAWSLGGDLAAVAALLGWSSYFVFSKRSAGVITSTEYTAGTGVWTTLVVGGAGFVFGQDLSIPESRNWVPLIVLVLVTGVVGHSLMNWSITRVPLWLASTLTLLVPVVSSIAGWIWLDEALTWVQMSAMAVVLGALALIVLGQQPPQRPQPQRQPVGEVRAR